MDPDLSKSLLKEAPPLVVLTFPHCLLFLSASPLSDSLSCVLFHPLSLHSTATHSFINVLICSFEPKSCHTG